MPTEKKQFVGQLQRPGNRPENVELIGYFREPLWRLFVKSLNETRNSTDTLADDAELSIPVEANETYSFRAEIWFDTSATPDFKFAVTGPSSPTEITIRGHFVAVGGTNDTDFVDTSFGVSHSVTGTGGTTGGHVKLKGLLQNGANAGAITLQWAQNTSDAADTTVLGGSYIERFRVGFDRA